jgi:hypothetical protein
MWEDEMAGNVGDVGENRSLLWTSVGKIRGWRALRTVGADERIILKLVLRKQDGTSWTEFI